MQNDAIVGLIVVLVWLLIYGGIAGSAAYIANRKGRSGLAWFLICFFLIGIIGLIIVACLPSIKPAEPKTVAPPPPPYDVARWSALVASDPEIAASVNRLRPHGEQYVHELAPIVLAQGKQDIAVITERLIAKAKADAALLADTARLEQIGRHVGAVFRTSRGLVAQLNDWRVLAKAEGAFKVFTSAADYREHYGDQDMWSEVTTLDEKRNFIVAARVPLEQINAMMPA